MLNLNLPPWLRQLQQAWWVHLIVIPAVLAGAPAFYECAGDGFSHLSFNCFKLGGAAALAWILRTFGHSPGSASFNPDGTANKQVAEVVAADKAQAPVAVVPVASADARDQIESVVSAGAPVAVVAAPTVALSATIKQASADPSLPTVASVVTTPQTVLKP